MSMLTPESSSLLTYLREMNDVKHLLRIFVIGITIGCTNDIPKDLANAYDSSDTQETVADADADGGVPDDTSSTDDTSSLDDSGSVPPDTGDEPFALDDGETCAADAECASTHCECVNFDCSERVCAPLDCLCGYGTSGSCDESMVGTPDPEDCEGELECAPMNDCVPVGS
jgi:hypothetical protein